MKLDIAALQLKRGSHLPNDTKMCVMEAVAIAAGEAWTDNPKCASPVLSQFLRRYNDAVNDEVRQTLKVYILRMVGTRGIDALECRRAAIKADWAIRIFLPAWLRAAGLTVHAEALASLPEMMSLREAASTCKLIDKAEQAAMRLTPHGKFSTHGGGLHRLAHESTAGYAALHGLWYFDGRGTAESTAVLAVSAVTESSLKSTVDELQASIPALIERMLLAS